MDPLHEVATQLANDITVDLARIDLTVDPADAADLALEVLHSVHTRNLIKGSTLGNTTPTPGSDIIPARIQHYVSTACLHFKHDNCRRRCKFCERLCRCPCHQNQDPPQPRTERYSIDAHTHRLSDTRHGYNVDEILAIARYWLNMGGTITITPDKEGEEPPGAETLGNSPPGI
jgi:hypothetical protein